MSKNKKKQPKSNIEIKIIIAAVIGILLELCAFNVLGKVGGWIRYGMFGLFGVMGYVFPIIGALAVIYTFIKNDKITSKIICSSIFFVFLCAFVHTLSFKGFQDTPVLEYFTTCAKGNPGGGIIGGLLAIGLFKAVGKAGTIIIAVLAIVVCLLIVFEIPIIEGIKMLFSKSKKEKDDEDEEPDKVVVPRKKSAARQNEETLFETQSEEGITIRIVQSKKKERHRAPLVRSENKATPLRDGSYRAISGQVAKGIGNVGLVTQNASGDEIHEITNATPIRRTPEVKIPKPVIQVTDVNPLEDDGIDSITMQSGTNRAEGIKNNLPEKPVKEKTVAKKPEQKVTANTKIAPEKKKDEAPKVVTAKAARRDDGYVFPPIELLSRNKSKNSSVSQNDMNKMAEKLENVLNQYGAYAKVINVQTGPTVTRFELQPESGVRVNKFTSLIDDLKLNLAVPDIRMEAPIPGKMAIGIEVPNQNSQKVLMRDLLEADSLKKHQSKIAIAAGVDISGNVVVADIASMPHILIGGTTGSGKSVFTKSLLMALLYRAKPSEVGLIIIDPKRVEFSAFNGIPHMMKEVVTDPGQAVSTLKWVVNEMDNRYIRMSMSGVSDISSYNSKFDRGLISEEEENPRKMQQIVIIIDEMADLMMQAAKEVEALIIRLAQLARAAGIHLIIATQRPSADVITGLIRANIPSRAALRVATGLESRIILDMNGAEELLGHGDMLFHPNGMIKPVRVQGALITDKEVNDVVAFLKTNNTSDYYAQQSEEINNYVNNSLSGQTSVASDNSDSSDKLDDYLFEAGMLCIEMGKASSSMLQRRFSIGFNRAARIIDQLTELGAVGPANGAKPREILVDAYTFEEMFQTKDE